MPYVFGVFGLVFLALMAFYIVNNSKKQTQEESEEKEGSNQDNNIVTGGGSNVNTGGGSNVNTGGGSNINTGGGNNNNGGNNNGGGGRSNGGGNEDPPPPIVTVYDPNEEDGKGVLNHQISLIENNPSSMAQIKHDLLIGGDKLWVGLDNGNFCSSGICRSIALDCQRFYKDKMTPVDHDWYDNKHRHSGVWTNGQKPSLRGDLQRIIDYKGGNPSQTDLNFVNELQFVLNDFGGARVFEWHGDMFRRKEKKVYNNIKTFCQNMIKEINRLETAVYNAAILTLETKDIRFKGINA